MLVYYLAAAECLVAGGAQFWGAWYMGPVAWLLPNLILASVWAATWGRSQPGLRVAIALVATTVPPIGVIGWASPLGAAGALFPGVGLVGLALTVAVLVAAAQAPRKASATAWTTLAVLANMALSANVFYSSPAPAADVVGIDTTFGAGRDLDGEFDRVMTIATTAERRAVAMKRGSVMLFPEAVVADYAEDDPLLARALPAITRAGVTVIVGAQRLRPDGSIENGLYELGAGDARWVNRIPVPGGLWHPWAPKGTVPAAWWSSGVQMLGDRRVAALVCHEQLLAWPALTSLVGGAELLVAPANLWFATGTRLSAIERQHAGAWGRLFRVPVVYATNR